MGKVHWNISKKIEDLYKKKIARFKSVLLQFCYLERIHRIFFYVQESGLYVMKEQKKNLEQR